MRTQRHQLIRSAINLFFVALPVFAWAQDAIVTMRIARASECFENKPTCYISDAAGY